MGLYTSISLPVLVKLHGEPAVDLHCVFIKQPENMGKTYNLKRVSADIERLTAAGTV